MNRLVALPALLVLSCGLSACTDEASATWKKGLEEELRRIDDEAPGDLGVYIKHLGDDAQLRYNAERFWYLGSAVKVPIRSEERRVGKEWRARGSLSRPTNG